MNNLWRRRTLVMMRMKRVIGMLMLQLQKLFGGSNNTSGIVN